MKPSCLSSLELRTYDECSRLVVYIEQEEVTDLRNQLEVAQGQNQWMEQRTQNTERLEESLREQHAEFAQTLNDELLCRCTTDALAAYLQLYPEGVLENMEELDGLITALSAEVGQQWET
ncbi:hypothetical protein GOP47_0008054 [Adiantum capillus-veneris]|uniref:Uncharacterized protein n=1 Tax=Adiantum capillus-veneris TaxID=13818 RepID=A0A9D4UY05_ADICA|nr:hypothetical protein GOP47_0008054 [Adiantum capillus-veneris]